MISSRVSSPRPLSFSLARFTSAAAVCAALTLAASHQGQAAPFGWDVDNLTNGILTSGSGTWDNALLNFTDPGDTIAHFAWNNVTNAGDTAFFGGTGGTAPFTITVGTITAAGVTFATPGYRLTGGTLTMGGGTIETTVDGRIDSVIAGAGGLTKTGTGTLILGGANTFTGPLTIAAGRLTLANVAALGSSAAGDFTQVLAGATLNLAGQAVANNPLPATPGEEFRIAGTGVGGIGALINEGPSQNNATGKVVLTADATINAGGSLLSSYNAAGQFVITGAGRFDIRLSAAPTAGQNHLDLAGFTLTKIGLQRTALVNASVSDGNIVVNEGQLFLEAGTLLQGNGTVTVNPNGHLGFFSIASGANVTRQIVINGGSIGDQNGTSAAQTINAPIQITGSIAPNFTSVSGTATTLAGLITENAFTGTTVTKRGTGLLIFNNAANSFASPITVHAGNLQGNYLTPFAGGVAPAVPVALTGTPLGTAGSVTVAGGTLNIRVDGASDNTNQVFTIGKSLVIDRAPSGINLDRISGTGTDKNLQIAATFAAPSAANGFSIGQNQLTGAQGNGYRTQFTTITMNSDTVLNVGDFTLTGDVMSANRNSLVHAGGNSWGFIGGTTQEFNAVFNLGAANLRIGTMFGTGVINTTATAGTGPIFGSPNSVITFRTPTNIATGQTVEIFSQRQAQGLVNLEQFTTVPANLRALGSGVLGVSQATAFGDVDLRRLGDGNFFLGLASNLNGAGTVTGVITGGAGGVVRLTGGLNGTLTVSGTNRITGTDALVVGSDLINGGFRSALAGNLAGTALLTGANNYSGGTTVNRTSILRFQTGTPGTGPITAFGNITAEGATGTFINGAVNLPVSLNGGSTLRFDSTVLTAGDELCAENGVRQRGRTAGGMLLLGSRATAPPWSFGSLQGLRSDAVGDAPLSAGDAPFSL